MFASAVQPPILSLFSSASTDCLSLFSTHTDLELPSDSFIHHLDDETSLPEPPEPQKLMKSANVVRPDDAWEGASGSQASANNHADGLSVSGPVLHIQSPTLPRAYIRCPPLHWKSTAPLRARDLGIKLEWLHLQVRNMGRPWSVEVGVVDVSGREGCVRCSTFQKQPDIRIRSNSLSLLHIPLKFPTDSNLLTAWCTISLHLSDLISQFSSLPLQTEQVQVPIPTGQFSHVSYVKIYASCRLRRIWFTAEKRGFTAEPWEFGLYSN